MFQHKFLGGSDLSEVKIMGLRVEPDLLFWCEFNPSIDMRSAFHIRLLFTNFSQGMFTINNVNCGLCNYIRVLKKATKYWIELSEE